MTVSDGAPAAPVVTPGFLREQRLRRCLTPVELAERIGVHPTSVLRWERGERLPGPAHLAGLARTLGVETAQVAAFFDARRPPTTGPGGVRGHGLRLLRDRARLPATKVASTVGVPPATVYNWEAGRARLPLEHLPALAVAFRLEVDSLRDLLVHTPAVTQRPLVPPLRRIRRRSGLSQGAVATRIGVSRHLVSRWERGERPPLVAVRRLARVYGVPVSTVARAAGVRPPDLLDPRRWTRGDLPEALRVLRQWSGLTQREVAVHCACSAAAVRAWERGRSVPRPAGLRRLEELFGLGPDALVRALPHQR